MIDTVQRWLNAISTPTTGAILKQLLYPIADRYSSKCFSSAGLAIKSGGSAVVKAGSAFYALANGVLLTKTANTDMAALSGTVTNATFNVFGFYVDSAGNLTSAMGSPGATLAAVKFPPHPPGKACIGYVVINPTGTGDFTGGTTALDDGTVVPNAAYINTVSPFDQTVVLGTV